MEEVTQVEKQDTVVPFKANGSAEPADAVPQATEPKVDETVELKVQIATLTGQLKQEQINRLLERRNAIMGWNQAGQLELELCNVKLKELGYNLNAQLGK